MKVQPGDPLKIPADVWNALVDASDAEKLTRHGRTARFSVGIPNGVIKVKNSTGSDRNRWSVLGLSAPLVLPTDDEAEFGRQVAFDGAVASSSYAGKCCILQEPIAAGKYGRAIASGLTVAEISVSDSGHGYADPSTAADILVSAASGSAQIVWKESGTGTKWGVVRLSAPASSGSGTDWSYYRQRGTSPLEIWYAAGLSGVAGSVGGMTLSADVLYAMPFVSARSGTLDRLGIYSNFPAATRKVRLGIYTSTSASNLYPDELVVDSGELTATVGLGAAVSGTISQALSSDTLYWFVALANGTLNTLCSDVAGAVAFSPILGTSSSLAPASGMRTHLEVANAYGALPDPFPASATAETPEMPFVYCRYSA